MPRAPPIRWPSAPPRGTRGSPAALARRSRSRTPRGNRAATGRTDIDLSRAAEVVAPVPQCDMNADQLGIAPGELREPLVDEGAPLGLHADVLGLDLDVHTSLRCNRRTHRPARRRAPRLP